MSCASFFHVSERSRPLPSPPKSPYDQAEEHAALIGLQALTLNLASANRDSEKREPRKKCLKPLRISTARKTPEKHVSISPLSATPRSSGSGSTPPRFRPSPCRSDSSGFQSLPSPSSTDRLFTNRSNVEIKTSDSMESLNTRASGSSGGARTPRQIRSRSRQGTPQPRHDGRGDSPRPLDEFTSVFDVQHVLKKGEVIEGVLRFDRRSFQHAYISAPVNIDRADGHLKWRNQ